MRSIPILLAPLFLLTLIPAPDLIAAGDTITLVPGKGKIKEAINQYGAEVVYRLQAGGIYELDGILSVSSQVLGGTSKTLTIVGEETNGMPAMIQVGRTRQGTPEKSMFNCSANLTLRNLFLTGKDAEGAFCENIITLNASIRVLVDKCVIDPAGTRRTFNGAGEANGSCLYLTNSQIYRNGSMASPNDGGWLGGMSWDTLWVENNTLVSSGQDFIGGAFHREPNNQFIWINHNTILWHDVWIKKSFNDQNFYFTNNLLHDESLFPELPRWYPFFPDFEQGNTLLCQTAIDTLEIGGVKESLPSERRMFWAYNLMYFSPELKKVPKYAADHHIELAYLLPMLWDEDVPLSYSGGVEVLSPKDSCRETRILSDTISWPYMKYKHNWYDLDPNYTDSMIYQISDSAGQHILGFYRGQFWNEADAPLVEDLPSYNWDIDGYSGRNPAEPPSTWPRFDATYSHEDLLTASIESLPLGDLNWYPDQKFKWFANREMIESHILDLNEDRFELQDPGSIKYPVELTILDENAKGVSGAALVMDGDTIAVSGASGAIELDTISGNYTVVIGAAGYMEYTGSITVAYAAYADKIILQSTLGISGHPLDALKVNLFPNPARDFLTLELEEYQDAEVKIFNILGTLVKEVKLNTRLTHIDLEGMNQGIYMLKVQKPGMHYTGRVIITKIK